MKRMKKVVCGILAMVIAVAIMMSLSGCSSHECSRCGTTENVHKNRVTAEDIDVVSDDMSLGKEAVKSIKEIYPYLCDDCFDKVVEKAKDTLINEALNSLGIG